MTTKDDGVISAGSLLIKEILPASVKPHYNMSSRLDKKGISSLVSTIIKHSKDESEHESINRLGKLFFQKATDLGISIPLSDFHNDSADRAALLSEFETKVHKILDSKLPELEKNRKLEELAIDYRPRIEKQNLDYLLSKGSNAAKMTLTGARGNTSQLMQSSAGNLLAIDSSGKPVPVPVKSSFAEGMTPAEHLAMSYSARGNTVLTQLSTALPGALFKKLTPNIFHEVITEDDCGTHNGIFVKGSDKLSILGRYLADTNKLVNDDVYNSVKSMDKVKVRSSLTCESPKGICAHCYGLLANSKKPEIGFNVGVVASQSVSEVLTQAMLSTKHTGGIAGRKRNAYETVNNLLSNPENFQDLATISQLNGDVSKIHKTSLNDHVVTIGGTEHFIPNIQDVSVKHGDTVKAGQKLSTGTINPRELTTLLGIGDGRKYFAEALRNEYGGGLDPRHFELISKNMIKYVRIDHPGSSDLGHGEIIDVNTLEPLLRQDEKKVSLSNAQGKVLSRKVLELTPGTTLTQNHVDYLANHGVSDAHVSSAGIKITPLVPGLQTSKLLDPNWISKLSFNHLRDTIQNAAVLGHKSDVHSTDPIAPYIMGNEFGEGDKGKY